MDATPTHRSGDGCSGFLGLVVVATFIQTKSGPNWYTDLSIGEVLRAIRDEQEIPVWWCAPWNHRYRESLLLLEDELAFLRTESDDG